MQVLRIAGKESMKMKMTCMSTEPQSLPLNYYLGADKGVPLPYKSYSKFNICCVVFKYDGLEFFN